MDAWIAAAMNDPDSGLVLILATLFLPTALIGGPIIWWHRRAPRSWLARCTAWPVAGLGLVFIVGLFFLERSEGRMALGHGFMVAVVATVIERLAVLFLGEKPDSPGHQTKRP